MSKIFAEAFYHSKQWKAVRREVLRRDHYTCHDCYARASEVHHVIELDTENINDPKIALNPDNLMSLCWSCHQKITKGYTGAVIEGYIFNEDGQMVPQ